MGCCLLVPSCASAPAAASLGVPNPSSCPANAALSAPVSNCLSSRSRLGQTEFKSILNFWRTEALNS